MNASPVMLETPLIEFDRGQLWNTDLIVPASIDPIVLFYGEGETEVRFNAGCSKQGRELEYSFPEDPIPDWLSITSDGSE